MFGSMGRDGRALALPTSASSISPVYRPFLVWGSVHSTSRCGQRRCTRTSAGSKEGRHGDYLPPVSSVPVQEGCHRFQETPWRR